MRKGFICGVFDLFHYGHILALKECREHCEHLTVAVNRAENIDSSINPGKSKPVFPAEHRKEILRECRLVDEVLEYNSEEELLRILELGKFDVRFLGADYKGKGITGAGLSKEIVYLDRSHGLSTSLFKKILADRFAGLR